MIYAICWDDSAHLSAESEGELLDYGKSIGIKAKWLQRGGQYDFHFEVFGKHFYQIQCDERVKKIGGAEFRVLLLIKRQSYLPHLQSPSSPPR